MDRDVIMHLLKAEGWMFSGNQLWNSLLIQNDINKMHNPAKDKHTGPIVFNGTDLQSSPMQLSQLQHNDLNGLGLA